MANIDTRMAAAMAVITRSALLSSMEQHQLHRINPGCSGALE
jgi:hypothetical protein